MSFPSQMSLQPMAIGKEITRIVMRGQEFMRLVCSLWTGENATFTGEYFQVTAPTVAPRLAPTGDRRHPRLYFGGASEAAERVAATGADVQLFWGEPLDGVRARIERLKSLSKALDSRSAATGIRLENRPLVRDTTEQAWADAETKWPR
jgi:alkanesulfonate monooxygenase